MIPTPDPGLPLEDSWIQPEDEPPFWSRWLELECEDFDVEEWMEEQL